MSSQVGRYLAKLARAEAFLRQELGAPPRVAVVLGSGLSAAAESWPTVHPLPYRRIPHFPPATVPGHPGHLWLVQLDNGGFVALSGRSHFYEGLSLPEVVFSVRALARWGVSVFILTNLAGAIHPRLRPGDLMVLSDHINFMGDNPLRHLHLESLGERFVDLTQAYDLELQALAHRCASDLGVELKQGVYLAVPGPHYETPAEIHMFERLGADAVGMSTVPEVIALAQMGRRTLAIACISNPAAGLSPQPLSHQAVLQAAGNVAGVLGRLLLRIAAQA